MRAWVLVAGVLVAGMAHAHDAPRCPWSDGTRADAAAHVARVDMRDHTVNVRGPHNRRHFERALHVCGESDALHQFRQWRRWRRTTNWMAVGGLLVPYVWLGLPVTASMAGVKKQAMLRELED